MLLVIEDQKRAAAGPLVLLEIEGHLMPVDDAGDYCSY